jgi:predicted CXXCH cytochrome family protein
MKRRTLYWLIALWGVGGVLLTAGCNSMANRKWLMLFFDGVPDGNQGTNRAFNVASVAETNQATEPSSRAVIAQPAFYYAHPPFGERKCGACHESNGGQSLRSKTPGLCFECHKDFLATAKVKHQPVESGECSSCHDPHQSYLNKNLLLKTGKELCYDCHDDLLDKKKFKHQPAENGECIACHDPHASANKKLLVKKDAALCWDCHDNFMDKAKVKHQPAENGECISCHNPHATDQKKLLVKSSPKLCWDCHDNFLEKAKFKHDVVEDCTTCHDPHRSGEAKLLTKNISKLCFDCHEEKDIAAIKGHANAAAKSCVDCHDPHTGDDKNLLKAAAKISGSTK